MSLLAKQRVIQDSLGDLPIVLMWSPGTSSALDNAHVAKGREDGTVGVFDRRLEGKTLTISSVNAGFVDAETSSTWRVDGVAIAGPLKGKRLSPLARHEVYWFAWTAFVGSDGLYQ